MTCYAVIDTNVLVSALLTAREDAATVLVVSRMLAGEITPLYSPAILREYRQVLARAKFGFDAATVSTLIGALEAFGIPVDPSPTGMVLPDMKDLPFYEVVLEKREDDARLVTGNLKHFPVQPFVVTPRQMLDILNGKA